MQKVKNHKILAFFNFLALGLIIFGSSTDILVPSSGTSISGGIAAWGVLLLIVMFFVDGFTAMRKPKGNGTVSNSKLSPLRRAFTYFFLIVIGLVILLIAKAHLDEHYTKTMLGNESSMLHPPPTCVESSKEYTSGGVDTVSTWSIHYTCNTTGKQAYDYIIGELKQRGYNEIQDYSKGGPGIFYSFSYSSSKISTQYDFNGLDGATYTLEQKSQLEQAPVTNINLELTRAP